jgi:hypothetical protein
LTGGKILDADDKVVSSEMVPLTHMGASSINATAGEAAFRLLARILRIFQVLRRVHKKRYADFIIGALISHLC